MDSILGSVFGPQNGVRFVGKIVVTERKKAQVSIVSSCTRQKFPIPLGFQGFAAPRVLVLHTLRTLMSTHVLGSRACADIHACRAWRTIARGAAKSWKPSGMQNLSCTRGDNRNLHYFLPGGKNFADKTTPVSGSVFGPQNGGQVARTQANQIETE